MTATIDEPQIVEFPALKEARGKLHAKQDELAKIFADAGPEMDMSKVKSLAGMDSKGKVEHIGNLNAELDDLHKNVQELLVVAKAAGAAAADIGGRESGDGTGEDDGRQRQAKGQTFADAFIASNAFKGYKRGMGQGPTAQLDLTVKALFSTGDGWSPETTRGPRIEMTPTRPAPDVIDYFPQTSTGQTAVVYMEETDFLNTAAETAEGQQYPEGSFKLEEKSSPVRKVAVYIAVTDETLEDEPRARSYIMNRLPFMIRQRLDQQLLTGSGTGVNLLGVENVSGIQVQDQASDTTIDALYKLFRKIREDGFAEPNVTFIRPSNWEPVRLAKTTDGLYIWGHPSIPGPMTIFGVPVKETVAAPATKAIAGDFANFSEVAVRRGIDVQISNSHSDFFIRGQLAVRADLRVAALFYRPKAFGVVTNLP